MTDEVILIPLKNNSERLPEKNWLLVTFTLNWLKDEGNYLPVYSYGALDDEHLKLVKRLGLVHVQLTTEEAQTHLSATLAACSRLNLSDDTKVVMLQVTQPLRREGLLYDTLSTLDRAPDKAVISASEVAVDNRLLTGEGKRQTDQPERLLLYDGAIYGGTPQTLPNWFSLEAPSNVVVNQSMSVVDIDTTADLTAHCHWR